MKKLAFLLIFFPTFLYSQIEDDFSDGNISQNPQWYGDTNSFEILDPPTSGNGSINSGANNDAFVLSSKQNTADAILLTESTIAEGEWRFSVADGRGWSVSSTNDYKIILMTDDSTRTNLVDGSHDFNGYFVQFDGGSSDNFVLYKQTADVTTELINTAYPDGADGSTPIARTIKITRDETNTWSVFIDEGFEIDPTTLRGIPVVDAEHASSSFFGIATNISSPSETRTLYFDDLYIGPIISDTTAPEITMVQVVSANELHVFFNEELDQTTAETINNYIVDNGMGSPTQAILDDDTIGLVKLAFANAFPDGIECTLTVNNVEDIEGNATDNEQTTFTYTAPVVTEYRDIIINEIFADPSPQVGLPTAEFIEIFNISNKTFNLEEWQLTDQSSIATLDAYILAPDEYLILCANDDTTEYSTFGAVMGVSNWPSLNNSGDNLHLIDNNGLVIDSVEYADTWYQDVEKAEGGWSLELINPEANTNCPIWQNWIASNDTEGGTPSGENSVYNTQQDTENPSILNVEIMDAITLKVTFSEALFEPNLPITSNYTIDNGIGNPTSITVDESLSIVSLTLGTPLQEDIVYTLTTLNLSDCSGNEMQPNTFEFYFSVAGFGDIIISEIFADPTPQVGLPQTEYIEIFNKTSNTFDLTAWKFSDGSSTAEFPIAQINAESYLILCNEEDTALFADYGDVVGLQSFPSLNNSGENLTLYNNNDEAIDSVQYALSWYNDEVKEDGGWSLELINPNKDNSCPVYTNWTASINTDGGTPGIQNSVYSTVNDATAPEVISISVISSDSVQVLYNEAMDVMGITPLANYVIDNSIGSPVEILVNELNNSIVLILENALQEGTEYTLTITNQSDCSGNAMSDFAGQIFFSIAEYKDLIISEIFADPSPQVALPTGEFVEIYNNSTKPFDLSGWELGFNTTTKELPNYVIQPQNYLVICDDEYIDAYETYGEAIAIVSFPSLTNDGGTVYLFNNNAVLIDSVTYDETFYKDNAKDNGGWTLELINPNPNPSCPAYNNWIASNDMRGGTPSEINSVFNDSPDVTEPEIVFIEVLNELQLKVYFSEAMDADAISNYENYMVDNGIGNPMLVEPNINLTEVTLTTSVPIQQKVTYVLSMVNISDCSGNNLLNPTKEFLFYLPEIYDITINEIMADPSPVVALPDGDYVELHNKTSYPINLDGWTLEIGTTVKKIEGNFFIEGNGYLILCNDDEQSLFDPYGSTYAFSALSLTDEKGLLVLRDAGTNLIHFVNYNEEWYDLDGKKEGGWSLEQIDPNNPCGAEYNWTGSQDISGGTPGAENAAYAVNEDVTSPELQRVSYMDSTTITAYFTEILDSIPIRDISAYVVDNEAGNPIDIVPVFPDYSSVILTFETPFEKGITYTLNVIDSIKDCAGNYIAANTSVVFAVPEAPQEKDLVINEILSNPKENGVDFIEIYNNSEKVIDLKHLRLASFDEYEQKPDDMTPIAPEGWLMFPMDYYVLTTSPYAVKKQYYAKNPNAFIEMDAFPSYSNDEGEVILAKIDSTYIDNVKYNDDMHFQLLNSTDGVSLERLNFDRSSDEESNWLSASETVGFATPGYLNSQYNQNIGFSGDITIDPEIFSPDNDGYNDVLNIGYAFTEPGYTMNIEIFDAQGCPVRELVSSKYLGTKEGTISWDGITDDNEKANIGIYLIYIEVFDLNGNVKHYKKTATLATKL